MHLLCLCSIYMKLSKTTGLLTTNRWILRGRMWVRKCPISRVLYQLRMVKNCLFRLPKFRDMPAIVVLKFHNLFLGGRFRITRCWAKWNGNQRRVFCHIWQLGTGHCWGDRDGNCGDCWKKNMYLATICIWLYNVFFFFYVGVFVEFLIHIHIYIYNLDTIHI